MLGTGAIAARCIWFMKIPISCSAAAAILPEKHKHVTEIKSKINSEKYIEKNKCTLIVIKHKFVSVMGKENQLKFMDPVLSINVYVIFTKRYFLTNHLHQQDVDHLFFFHN